MGQNPGLNSEIDALANKKVAQATFLFGLISYANRPCPCGYRHTWADFCFVYNRKGHIFSFQ